MENRITNAECVTRRYPQHDPGSRPLWSSQRFLYRRCLHGPRVAIVLAPRQSAAQLQRTASHRIRSTRVHIVHGQLDGLIAVLQEMSVPEAGPRAPLLDMQTVRAENGPPLPLARDVCRTT